MLAQLRYLTGVSCRAVTQQRQSTSRCQLTGTLSARAVLRMAEAGATQALPEVVETKGVPVSYFTGSNLLFLKPVIKQCTHHFCL